MAELANTSLINDSSLKGYWKLDSTTDSSGNGGTLTLVNSPSYASGKFGNCIDFETSSAQYVYTGDSTALSITGAMTISAWINIESLPGSGATAGIVTKFNATSNNRSYYLRLFNSGGTQRVEAAADQLGTSITYDHGYWTPTLATGTWYHLVLTITPANASASTFELFVDGVSQGNGTMITSGNISSIYDGTANLGIGGGDAGSASEFDGKIDDVAIFNRVLSPHEISMLYYDAPESTEFAQNTLYVPHAIGDVTLNSDGNLQAYYKLESGALTTDSKGSYTLTNQNTVAEATGILGGAANQGNPNSSNKLLYRTASAPALTGNFSIVGWVKFNEHTASQNIFSWADTTNDVFARMQWYQPSGYFTFYRVKNGVAQQGPTYTFTPTDGVWYHYAMTYDGVNVRGYLNGNLVGGPTAASGSGSSNVTSGLGIGIDAQDYGSPISGSTIYADDVGFFDKALSQAEIATLCGYPTAYYKLDDVNDSMATARNLTNNNSATFTSGRFGNAVNLGTSNTNKYLNKSSDNYEIAGTQDLTISLWYNPTAQPGNNVYFPLAMHRTSKTTARYIVLHYFNNAGTKQIFINNSSTTGQYNVDLTTNTWYHIVLVRNGSTGTTLYVNGVKTGLTVAQGADAGGSNNDFWIGSDQSNYASGMFDDVAIWGRALSASEVTNIYNGGSPAGGFFFLSN